MQDKTISVFGASGFLGRYVVKHLADAGYRIRAFSRHPDKAYHLKPLGTVGQISTEYADISKEDALENALEGSYGAVNLVGILFQSGKQKFAKIHAQGAERIAQQAAASGVKKLVHISALGVDKADRSAYARTKFAGEKAVLAAFPSATILRPSVVFGPEDNFFNLFACMSKISPTLPLIGGGKSHFQPVYADDVAKAVAVAFEKEETQGQVYELGGPEVMSFKELLEYMLTHLKKSRFLAPIPYPIASIMGSVAQILPSPPLTADQVTLLKDDNVVDDEAMGFADLGIIPTPMDAVVPDYLDTYIYKG